MKSFFATAILAITSAAGAGLWAQNFGAYLFVLPIVWVWILKQ